MRIFKHRGDIYFSKVNKEKSNEQKILLIALVAIVSFTIIFVTAVSIKNNFSAKKFFEPENTEDVTAVSQYEYEEIDLPEVSGKNNFIAMIYENNTLLFATLVQVDLDTTAFKASTLKGDTEIDGTTLNKIYSESGAQNVSKAVSTYFGIDIDYYLAIESLNYREFYNELGSIRYPILNDIKYKNDTSPVHYSIKMNSGEQDIDGKEFVNLIRYYLDTNNTSAANELFLASLSQQLNGENYKDRDDLFKTFSSICETNITIRDFSKANDGLEVISNDQTSMGVYNAAAEYDNNKITEDSLKSVKGYFVK